MPWKLGWILYLDAASDRQHMALSHHICLCFVTLESGGGRLTEGRRETCSPCSRRGRPRSGYRGGIRSSLVMLQTAWDDSISWLSSD